MENNRSVCAFPICFAWWPAVDNLYGYLEFFQKALLICDLNFFSSNTSLGKKNLNSKQKSLQVLQIKSSI
jgi:hypothetical protein